jgi:hypothetical protein
MHIGFWRDIQKEIYCWAEQTVGRWIILKWIIREIGWDGMDWIDLDQDRDQWKALMNTIINLRIS